MCKEMNEFGKKIINYDLLVGLFMSLFIGLILTFKCAIIYYIGLVIAAINFKVSSYLVERFSMSGKAFILILASFIRIAIIVLVAVPFIGKLEWIGSYLFGFTSHFIFMMIYCILKKKGSD